MIIIMISSISVMQNLYLKYTIIKKAVRMKIRTAFFLIE